MNNREFGEFVEEHQQRTLRLILDKNEDYKGAGDSAFSNFYEEAKHLGLTPEQVWHVWMCKHWSAITTYCREGAVRSEPIEGRIYDMINYGYLLLGIVQERAWAEAEGQKQAETIARGAALAAEQDDGEHIITEPGITEEAARAASSWCPYTHPVTGERCELIAPHVGSLHRVRIGTPEPAEWS